MTTGTYADSNYSPHFENETCQAQSRGHLGVPLGNNGAEPQNPDLQIPRSVLMHTCISHFFRLCLILEVIRITHS